MHNSQLQHRGLWWGLAIASILGFADSMYLTAKFYQGDAPSCVLFSGCDVVALSSYSTIAGIPVALLGALFYLVVFVSVLAFFQTRQHAILKGIVLLSFLAFLFTLYLLYLQAIVIEAFCVYCVFSAGTTIAVFVLALMLRGVSKSFSRE